MTRPSRSIFDEKTVRADATQLRITHRRIEAARFSGSGKSTGQRSREIVVRVLNKGKTVSTAYNQARYVSRTNTQEHGQDKGRKAPISLETHDGRTLTTRAEIDAEIRSWGMKNGDENRSKIWMNATNEERKNIDQTWREASPEWRKENPKQDPYKAVQTAHIIVSVPEGRPEQISEAVRSAALDFFAGHRYVYAIHNDHGRGPHAHILVHAPNQDTGYQLRLKKPELEAMRHRFAEAARNAGIDVTASRRVDRLAHDIAAGVEPFHKHDRSRRWTPGDTIRQKAPRWHDSHYGQEYSARAAGLPSRDQPRPIAERFLGRSPPEAKSDAFRETAKQFSHYKNPHEATKSYLALYAENPRLAQWAYTRHPVAFGHLALDAAAHQWKAPDGRVAAKAVREVNVSKLYPSAKAERVHELANAVPAARAGRRRERGATAVAQSQTAFARDAAQAGDPLAAADAQARSRAARQGAPVPGFRRANQNQENQKVDMNQIIENKKVAKFAELDMRVKELQRENKENPSKEIANLLIQAQILRRKAAISIAADAESLEAAKSTGLATRIQKFSREKRGGISLSF